jgi:SH3/ankyrin repeat-containing protein
MYVSHLINFLHFQDLKDPLNYGIYMPPMNGRAGKFLEEERLLREYPLHGPIGFIEVMSY